MHQEFEWQIEYIAHLHVWLVKTSRPELNGIVYDDDMDSVIESLRAIKRGEA